MNRNPPPSSPDTDIVQATQVWRDSVPHSEAKRNTDTAVMANVEENGFATTSTAPPPRQNSYVQPPATMLLHPSIATDEATPTSSTKLHPAEANNRSDFKDSGNIWATSTKNKGRPTNEEAHNVNGNDTGVAKVSGTQHVRSESPPAVFGGGGGGRDARMDDHATRHSTPASPPLSLPHPLLPLQLAATHYPPPPGPPSSTASSMRIFAPLTQKLKRNGTVSQQNGHHVNTNPRVEDVESASAFKDVTTVKQTNDAEKRASRTAGVNHGSHRAASGVQQNGPVGAAQGRAADDGEQIEGKTAPIRHYIGRHTAAQESDDAANMSSPLDDDYPTAATYRSTPLAGRRMPASTQYPSTLHSHEWTDVESAATTTVDNNMTEGTVASSTAADPGLRDKHRNMDPISVIREGLGWLPARYLEEMNKEELKELVLSAIESMNASQAAASRPSWDQQVQGIVPNPPVDEARQTSYDDTYDSDNETAMLQHSFAQLDADDTQGREVAADGMEATSPNDYYEKMTKSKMPVGWTAEYDHQQHAWYFVDSNASPPRTTWDDPRGKLSPDDESRQPDEWSPERSLLPWPGARPYPDYMSEPETARAYADWYAKTFAGFQAYRQYVEGKKGPVAAAMDSEKKRTRRLSRAQALIQEASRRLGEANAGTPTEEKTREKYAAERDLSRAQGMIDRLQYDDERRKAAVPTWMTDYQGVTRGFEAPSERRRMHYVDASPRKPRPNMAAAHAPPMSTPLMDAVPMQQWPSSSVPGAFYGGMPAMANGYPDPTAMLYAAANRTLPMAVGPPPGAAAAAGGSRLPGSMNMPTVYPAPPGMRAKGSATPTPYGLPEACFAWDMVLRSAMPTDKLVRRPSYRGYDGAGNVLTQHPPAAMHAMLPRR